MNSDQKISEQLVHLRLPFIRQHYQSLADEIWEGHYLRPDDPGDDQ